MNSIFKSLLAAAALLPATTGCHSHPHIQKLTRSEAENRGLVTPRQGKMIEIPSGDLTGLHVAPDPKKRGLSSRDQSYVHGLDLRPDAVSDSPNNDRRSISTEPWTDTKMGFNPISVRLATEQSLLDQSL